MRICVCVGGGQNTPEAFFLETQHGRHPSHAISRHQSSNFTLALHTATCITTPNSSLRSWTTYYHPSYFHSSSLVEPGGKTTFNPIQDQSANDSSLPLRFPEGKKKKSALVLLEPEPLKHLHDQDSRNPCCTHFESPTRFLFGVTSLIHKWPICLNDMLIRTIDDDHICIFCADSKSDLAFHTSHFHNNEDKNTTCNLSNIFWVFMNPPTGGYFFWNVKAKNYNIGSIQVAKVIGQG